MMKKMVKRIATVVVAMAVLIAAFYPAAVDAAAKAALNKKSATLTITDKKVNPSVTIKVKNAKKAPKWTVSNKKVVTVKKTGKNTVKITAKKAGKVTVVCKVNGKNLKCKIKVVDKRKPKKPEKPDTGGKDTETTDTGNGTTENTGDTEDDDTDGGNTEIPSSLIWKCGTHLKTGGICGWSMVHSPNDGTKEEIEALSQHMYKHLMNGEIPQYN